MVPNRIILLDHGQVVLELTLGVTGTRSGTNSAEVTATPFSILLSSPILITTRHAPLHVQLRVKLLLSLLDVRLFGSKQRGINHARLMLKRISVDICLQVDRLVHIVSPHFSPVRHRLLSLLVLVNTTMHGRLVGRHASLLVKSIVGLTCTSAASLMILEPCRSLGCVARVRCSIENLRLLIDFLFLTTSVACRRHVDNVVDAL